jgi:hypothetical protein
MSKSLGKVVDPLQVGGAQSRGGGGVGGGQ